jgi:hypothetical protein
MRMRVFDRLMKANAWVAATFSIFSAISILNVPDNLLVTPRLGFVFTHLLSQPWFAGMYLIIAFVACIGIVHEKVRWVGFTALAAMSIFWAGVGIIPAMMGLVPQGNILETLSNITLALYGGSLALLCYERYNRRPALRP